VKATVLPAHVATQNWDDFEGLLWGQAGAHHYERDCEYIVEQCRRMGYTTLMVSASWHPTDPLGAIRGGARVMALNVFSTHDKAYAGQKAYRESGDKMMLKRTPSLADPAFREGAVKECVEVAEKWAGWHPLGYCFADELRLSVEGVDLDFSPASLEQFRGWLKKEYASLDALNASWGTGYGAWAQVVPDTTSEARESGRYAAWVDFRRFGDFQMADFHQLLVEAMKARDPKARFGLSGTQVSTAYTGADWSQLCRVFSYLSSYSGGGELPIMSRDFMPDARIAVYAAGYNKSGQKYIGHFWHQMLQGQAGFSAWTLNNMVNPDLTISKPGQSVAIATKAWRDGLGKLFMHMQWKQDRVAMLYSMPSITVASLYAGNQRAASQAWLGMVKDSGLTPKFLSEMDLKEGKLTRENYDVMLLPMCVALSDADAATLRAFASAGGTLIADAAPGVTDEHGKFRAAGVLDDVFGIAQPIVPRLAGKVGELKFAGEAMGLNLGTAVEGTRLLSGDLQLAGAVALAEMEGTPAYTLHRYGEGGAVCLNILTEKYNELKVNELEAGMRDQFQKMLTWGGIQHAVRIVDRSGGALPIEISRYVEGVNQYIGVAEEEIQAVDVVMQGKGHVYEMRSGKYLGLTDRVSVTLPANDGYLLSSLAYKVAGVKVSAAKRVGAGEDMKVELAIEADGELGLHCVRLELLDASGEAVWHYGQNLLLHGGVGSAVIPLRHDVKGKCRVVARDVATGVVGEVSVLIE